MGECVKKIRAWLADMPVKARVTFWIFYAILTVYLFCIQYDRFQLWAYFPLLFPLFFIGLYLLGRMEMIGRKKSPTIFLLYHRQPESVSAAPPDVSKDAATEVIE